jgi:hypothetical protein
MTTRYYVLDVLDRRILLRSVDGRTAILHRPTGRWRDFPDGVAYLAPGDDRVTPATPADLERFGVSVHPGRVVASLDGPDQDPDYTKPETLGRAT